MTEAEWLACSDPKRMLALLNGKVSGRKLRLFAVACCRRKWHLLEDVKSRAAVAVAEAYADGMASDEDVDRASANAGAAYAERYWEGGVNIDGAASCAAGSPVCLLPTDEAVGLLGIASGVWDEVTGTEEQAAQAALLRDVVGNPFHPHPPFTSWPPSNVVRLARTIYDERAFERMPVLADVLERTRCAAADLLNHCRGGGPHVRGCWVVDLVLGKS